MALPGQIYVEESSLSLSGRALFAQAQQLRLPNVQTFVPQTNMISAAAPHLYKNGLEFSQNKSLTIDFAGVPFADEKIFQANVVVKKILRPNGERMTREVKGVATLGKTECDGPVGPVNRMML